MRTFHVNALYSYKFISQCLPIYAFYTILFIERGQSVTDIAVLIALWSVFTIVLEIPSGILADRWNRRNMLVMGAVMQGMYSFINLCILMASVCHSNFWNLIFDNGDMGDFVCKYASG